MMQWDVSTLILGHSLHVVGETWVLNGKTPLGLTWSGFI